MVDERRECRIPAESICVPGLDVRIKVLLGKRGRDAGRNHWSILRVRSARIDASSNRDPPEGTRKRKRPTSKERDTRRALPAAVSQLVYAGETHAGVIRMTGRHQGGKPDKQRKVKSS